MVTYMNWYKTKRDESQKNSIREIPASHWIAFALLLLSAFLIFFYTFSKIRTDYGTDIYPMGEQLFTEQMTDGDNIATSFAISENTEIEALRLAFVTYGVKDQTGTIQVALNDSASGETLGESSIDVSSIKEWEWMDFNFKTPVAVTAGQNLTVSITAVDFPETNALSVAKSDDVALALRIKSGIWDSFQKLFVLFAILLSLTFIFAFFAIYVWKWKLANIFLIVFTAMAIMFNLLVPAKLGPDEGAHLNTVYKISENLMGWQSSADDQSVITAEEADNGLTTDAPSHNYYVKYYNWLKSRTTSKQVETSYWGSQENPKVTYLPAAIGVVLGRLLHLSAAGIITMGRIISFIPVLFLLYYAIRRTVRGKELIFVLAMLPSMIQEATTINADGIDISLSLALTVAVMRVCYAEKDKFRYLDYGMIIATTLLLARCKYGALMPLALLPLLIFMKKRKETEREDKILSWASLALTIISVIFGFFPLIHRTVGAYSPTLWSDCYTFSDIIHDPVHIIFLLGSTIYHQLDFYLLTIGGTNLGWMNMILPQYITVVMLMLLFMSAIPAEKEKGVFSVKTRIFMFIVALMGIGFAVGGMLIAWTQKDAEFINGVQGRYFLPFVLLLGISLMPERLTCDDKGVFRNKVLIASVWYQIMVVCAIFLRA